MPPDLTRSLRSPLFVPFRPLVESEELQEGRQPYALFHNIKRPIRNRKVLHIHPELGQTRHVADDFPTLGTANVAVYWDYEHMHIPAWRPAAATTTECIIRNKAAKYGRIVEKKLCYGSRQLSFLPRSELDQSGVALVDCPSRNHNETLDKKFIVDVLCFSWERASLGAKACVVLITSDSDYSYGLARLDFGVFTVMIYEPDIVAKALLIDNANYVLFLLGNQTFVAKYLAVRTTKAKLVTIWYTSQSGRQKRNW